MENPRQTKYLNFNKRQNLNYLSFLLLRLQCGSAQYQPRVAVDAEDVLVCHNNHRVLTMGYTIPQNKKQASNIFT